MTDERGVRTTYSYTPDGKELTISDTQGNTTIAVSESTALEETPDSTNTGAEEESEVVSAEEEGAKEVLLEQIAARRTVDYYYYNGADRLVEVVEHNGKVFTYGYDGEDNTPWRTYSQHPAVKPPIGDGQRIHTPPNFPGKNKELSCSRTKCL